MKKIGKVFLIMIMFFSCFIIKISPVKADAYDKAEELVAKVCEEKMHNNEYCHQPQEMYIGAAQNYDYIAPIFNINPGYSEAGTQNIQVLLYSIDEEKIYYRGSYAKYFVMSYKIDEEDKLSLKFGLAFDPKSAIESLIEDDDNGCEKRFTEYLSVTQLTYEQDLLRKSGVDSAPIKNVLKNRPDYIKRNMYTFTFNESSAAEYKKYTEKMIENLHLTGETFRWRPLANESDDKIENCSKNYELLGTYDFTNDSKLVTCNNKSITTSESEIVFVSTKRKQEYKSAYFYRLLEAMLQYADSEEEFVRAYLKLSQIIDTGKYDEKTFTDQYYEATKDKMYTYMTNYLKSGINSDNVEKNSKSEFTNWFDMTGRYILEDGQVGVRRFKDYFTFLYADPTSYDETTKEYTLARTTSSDYAIGLDQESYELILKSINDMIEVKEIFQAVDNVKEHQCYIYCPTCIAKNTEKEEENKSACLACQNNNPKYGTCESCDLRDRKACEHVPGTYEAYCFEGKFNECLDKNIGKNESVYFQNAKLEFFNTKNAELNTTIDDFIYNIGNLDLYKNLDIRWKWYQYNGDCGDVAMFRGLWLFIVFGAPFVVLVMGTIDFFKIVMNPEEKEKKKNQKRFVRRIITLVILLLTPFIIKLIINNLAPSSSSARNIKLMQCIVNGN